MAQETTLRGNERVATTTMTMHAKTKKECTLRRPRGYRQRTPRHIVCTYCTVLQASGTMDSYRYACNGAVLGVISFKSVFQDQPLLADLLIFPSLTGLKILYAASNPSHARLEAISGVKQAVTL
jgi:hypothetical protein